MSNFTPSPTEGGIIRVYRVNGESGEPSIGEDVEVWEIRPTRHRYIGLGLLVGVLRRARSYREMPPELTVRATLQEKYREWLESLPESLADSATGDALLVGFLHCARSYLKASSELTVRAALQKECREWLESLPESLVDSTTAEVLREITEFDLAELESVEPPPNDLCAIWDYRESIYRGQAPHFVISGDYREARDEDDVRLPIVECKDRNEYLPGYPRCPDCGGAIGALSVGSKAARSLGVRVCKGNDCTIVECEACDGEGAEPCPDCNPEGDAEPETACETCNGFTIIECSQCNGIGELNSACGSTFVDTRCV